MDIKRAPPTLDTLPSEIRHLIVSYLAPSGNHTRGCKQDLKNANLAHSCLREWVPEIMYREMVLNHVSVDTASHLELFSENPATAELSKYVKSIQVQVPPAIRWEINTEHPFDGIEDIVDQRLLKKFQVKRPEQLTDEHRRYSRRYHRALIEPFTDNRRWYQLLDRGARSWAGIFALFPSLEHVSVGICNRVDHPSPTYTNLFVATHGKNVDRDVEPPFAEDHSVNQAWTSAVLLRDLPLSLKSLDLSVVNLDNYNPHATVNRLLSICYRMTHFSIENSLHRISRLVLRIKGTEGTHGGRNPERSYTGSAGMVRHWRKVLQAMTGLEHLDIRSDNRNHIAFTNGEHSDRKGCILDWLLSQIALDQIQTLRFQGFLLDEVSVANIFPTTAGSVSSWPNLKTLVFEDIRLMMNEEPEQQDTREDHVQHQQGRAWLQICQYLLETVRPVDLRLVRPLSNVNNQQNYGISAANAEKIRQLPNVSLVYN